MADLNGLRSLLNGSGGEQNDDYTNWKNQQVQNADMNEIRKLFPMQAKIYSFLPRSTQDALLRQNNYDTILKYQVDRNWENMRKLGTPTGGAAPIDYSQLEVDNNNSLLRGMNIPDELQQDRIASLPVSIDRIYSGIIGESPDQRFVRNQKERNTIYQNMTPQEKARGLLNINGIRVKWNEDNMNDVRKDFPDIGVG